MKHSALALFIISGAVAARTAEPSPAVLPVWDFEKGITNSLGGQYNAYQRHPSWLRTYLDPSFSRARGGHSLRVTAHREAEGFCGVWFDFHPASEAPRRYLDATSYRYLSFWARGTQGGEDFEIELTDEARLEDESERPRRPLRAYLPGGLSTSWQEVVIPLEDFRGLKAQRLVRMSMGITRRGDTRFFLDSISLKRLRAASRLPSDPKPAAERPAVAKAQRALWVWNTKPLFDVAQPGEADHFFAFCARQNIREIYLAVELDRPESTEGQLFVVRNPDAYRKFLARAHEQGLKAEALVGTPEWGARANHTQALAAVDAILACNRSSPARARFDGIHFDVEPYVLLGYSDPQYRPQILADFLEMASRCSARSHAGGSRFSCDVPSWFFPSGGLERDHLTFPFQGAEKTVGEHLIDILDSVTIMDYTNQADGAGGIIARGQPALAYAATRNKPVVVGLETFLEATNVVAFVCGLPAEEFWPRLAQTGLRDQLFYEDFRMMLFSDDVNVHIGLSLPRDAAPEKRAACDASLARLARKLGASSEPQRFPVSPMLDLARVAMSDSAEWSGFEPYEFKDPETEQPVQGFHASRRMQPSITFHGLGREVFEEEYNSAVEWLGYRPGFGGTAIHFYESFRELLEGQ
ncbi:MAG: hypothetical protein ABSG54_05045 [Terriglobia bacterium]|jgi:hypothetical protein